MVSRALIIKFGAIGDVVMAIPAVRELHDKGMQIDWVCGRHALPLLECFSWIRAIPADDAKILRGSVMQRIGAIAALWRSTIGQHYDLCATLYYDDRYKLLSVPVRSAKNIILSREARGGMLIPGRHHTDEYLRILLNYPDGYNAKGLIPVRPDRLPVAAPLYEKVGTRVALVPAGASNMMRQQTLRRWPIDHYVALARKLLARGYEVVLLGGPDDGWAKPSFDGLVLTDLIGTLSLPEVVLACDGCDVVISHDTGPLHLAGMSHAMVIGLFGPTDPGNFLPRREFVTGIWGGANLACRPCYDGRDFPPCQHNGCMAEVLPELVLRELDGLLDRKSKQLPSPPRVVNV